MRIASQRTVTRNTQIRRRYAYCAIERDMLGDDLAARGLAEAAFDLFKSRALDGRVMLEYAFREIEYRQLEQGN